MKILKNIYSSFSYKDSYSNLNFSKNNNNFFKKSPILSNNSLELKKSSILFNNSCELNVSSIENNYQDSSFDFDIFKAIKINEKLSLTDIENNFEIETLDAINGITTKQENQFVSLENKNLENKNNNKFISLEHQNNQAQYNENQNEINNITQQEFTSKIERPTYFSRAKNSYIDCTKEIGKGILKTSFNSIKAGISFAIPLIYSCSMLQGIAPFVSVASYLDIALFPFQKQFVNFTNSTMGHFTHKLVKDFPAHSLSTAGIFTLFGISEVVNLALNLIVTTSKSGFYLSKGNFFCLSAIMEKILENIKTPTVNRCNIDDINNIKEEDFILIKDEEEEEEDFILIEDEEEEEEDFILIEDEEEEEEDFILIEDEESLNEVSLQISSHNNEYDGSNLAQFMRSKANYVQNYASNLDDFINSTNNQDIAIKSFCNDKLEIIYQDNIFNDLS